MRVVNLTQTDPQAHHAGVRDADSQQHAITTSIALHLLPGVAMLMFAMLASPLVQRWQFPDTFTGSLGILFVLMPLELGLLGYLGYKRNHSPSLTGIVSYREPATFWHYTILVPLLIAWYRITMSAWTSIVPALGAAGAWLPAALLNPLGSGTGGTYSDSVLLTTAIFRIVCTAIIAPVVEELYFRGYLLPRIERFGHWAVVLNVVLFSFYHLWTPLLNPGRVLAWLPIVYLVWRKRNIRLGIVVHLLLNLIGVIGPLMAVFGRA
jgi:hypothetical protein